MAASQADEKLPIPSCTIEEAVEISKALFGSQMSLTQEDFKKPQYSRMRKFYTNLLVSHLHIPQEQLTQPHFSSMQAFEHPEIHEDSASLFTLTIALQRFMFACGVHDFTINDLLMPKPKRTLHCISAITNFLKFRNCRDEVYNRAIDEKESIEERHHQFLDRNAELRQKIQILREQAAAEEFQVQQMMPEIESRMATIAQLNKDQADSSKEYSNKKTRSAEMTSKKAELNVSLAGMKEQNDSLKSRIVQSPDRFKGEIARLNSAVQSIKVVIEDKNIRNHELANQADSALQLKEDVQNALKLINIIGAEIAKQRDHTAKLETAQDKLLTQKETLKDLTVKIQHLKRQLASKQEKASRTARQHEKKIVVLTEQTQQSKGEEARYTNSNVELIANATNVENKIQKIATTNEEKENHHEQNMAEMKDVYSQLLEQLDLYHAALNREWGRIAQVTS